MSRPLAGYFFFRYRCGSFDPKRSTLGLGLAIQVILVAKSTVRLKWTACADDGVMACICTCLLFLIPSDKFFKNVNGVELQDMILNKKDFLELAWDIIILFGAGFVIADEFENSGLSNVVGEELGNFVSIGNYGLVQMITVIVVMPTELTANTATASIIIPTVLSVANEKQSTRT